MLGIHQHCMINKRLWKSKTIQKWCSQGSFPQWALTDVLTNICPLVQEKQRQGKGKRAEHREEDTIVSRTRLCSWHLYSKSNFNLPTFWLSLITVLIPCNSLLREHVRVPEIPSLAAGAPVLRPAVSTHSEEYGQWMTCCSILLLGAVSWHCLTKMQSENTASEMQPVHFKAVGECARYAAVVEHSHSTTHTSAFLYLIWAHQHTQSSTLLRGYYPNDLI